jgi:hypothetical protein
MFVVKTNWKHQTKTVWKGKFFSWKSGHKTCRPLGFQLELMIWSKIDTRTDKASPKWQMKLLQET